MRLHERIARARSLLAVTGAGISAESGIPTYRGVAGLYEADGGEEIMARLSWEAWRRDPGSTFRQLNAMLSRCAEARPNGAHLALARLAERVSPCTVITQNVDGLHAEAGSKDVVELHGNILRQRCPRCPHRETVPRGALPAERRCPACGQAELRHDVVLFGEMLDLEVMRRYGEACDRRYDLCLVIGTTALFPYVQQVALDARARGAFLVEINPDETPVSRACDLVVRAPAGEALAGVE